MSVTNYIPSLVCGYKYSKLKNVVYLVTKDHLKNIHIDDGEAYIINLNETPMRVDCQSVEFTENESLDERYKFTKTLRFTVKGYANVSSLEGGCYAIVITTDGTPFMVNVDFPSKVTFTYTLTQKQNQTEFTLSSQSNYPTLKLNGSIDDATVFNCKPYAEYGIKDLQLIEKDYVTINDKTAVITTFGGRTFKKVEFLGEACTLTESFDGEVVTDTIQFDIAFDDYKPSWQYNLLEFMDNLYSAIVTPKSDTNQFFVGFNHGLDPSYDIQTTTNTGDSNKITVTLSEKSLHGLITLEHARIVDNTDTVWQYVENVYEYDTYECIDNGVAIYLAKAELDSQNNPTGNYKVLEGYESRFEGKFNIVGTFSEVVMFYTTKCSWFNSCIKTTDMPSLITFIGTVCHEYSFYCTCDWHFEEMPSYLVFNRTSGSAGVQYTIRICNTLATEVTVTDTFKVIYGSKVDDIQVQVITGQMKLQAYYLSDKMYYLPCDWNYTLTQNNVRGYEFDNYQNMKEAIIGACVETVGDRAFYQNTAMTSVTISSTVKYINQYAFEYNTALTGVTIPNSVISIGYYSFAYDSGMTVVNLGSGLQSIDNYAFYQCSNLTNVVIPNSVTFLGSYAFANNGALNTATLSNSLTNLNQGVFEYDRVLQSITIPNSVASIGNYCFRDCNAMTAATLSNKLTTIGSYAFYNDYNLGNVTFPNTLTRIESNAFRNCRGMSNVIIPSSVSYIGNDAFRDCANLEYIYMYPMTPPSVGNSYFFDNTNECPIYVYCEALPAYQAHSTWRKYAKRFRTFEGDCPVKLHEEFNDNTSLDIACNDSSTLTQSEVTMSNSASDIKSAIIGTCVTIVGNSAFSNASSLTSVTIPSSVVRIESNGFDYCSVLPSVYIPDSVKYIGNAGFRYNSSLVNLRLPNTQITPSRLPSGYEELEYIENNGTAYIETDYYPTNNTRVVGDFQANVITNNPRMFGAGAYNSLGFIVNIENTRPIKYYYKYGQSSSWLTTNVQANTNRRTIDLNKNNLYIDGTLVSTASESTFTLTSHLGIFNSPNSTAFSANEAFKGKCYYLEVYEDGVLVRRFLPCKRLSDNKIGMYDLRNNVFYGSANSSTFTGGNSTSGGLTIDSNAFRYCTSLSSVVLPNGLRSVGSYVFANDTSLSAITFGSGLSYVGDYMFQYCTALSGVTFPSNISSINQYAFDHCSALSAVTLPNTITAIGNYSFANCTSMSDVVIGNGISSIANYAFYNDSNLSGVTFGNSVTAITTGAFQSCTSLPQLNNLPNSLQRIEDYAFRYDSALQYAYIPSNVNYIGSQVFYNCTNLSFVYMYPTTPPTLSSSDSFNNTNNCPIYVPCESLAAYQTASQWSNVRDRLIGYGSCPLKIDHTYTNGTEWSWFCDMNNYIASGDTRTNPNQAYYPYTEINTSVIGNCVQSISAKTYDGCYNMTAVTIPNSVVRIGNYAFQYCSALPSVVIPNSVTYLGDYAFYNDVALTSVTISSGLTYISNYAFRFCTGLPNVTIPNSVTSLYNYSFANCTSLTSVTLSNNLTSIGQSAFEYDYNLASITLPQSLQTIGVSAFRLCSSLRNVTIPSNVTSIGSNAFSGDTSLQYVICHPLNPPTLGNINAFDGDSNATYPIYVHCEALGKYQKANNWKTIKHRLRPIETPCIPKLYAQYEDGQENYVYCDEYNYISQSDVRNDAPLYSIMTRAEIGDCVQTINSDTFRDCVLLQHATMYDTVTSINSSAFNNCSSLSGLQMSNNVQTIGAQAFYECTSLSGLTLPNTLTSIGNEAFYHCANIKNYITIPNSVTSLGHSVFENSYHITGASITSGITSIPYDTFKGCLALKSVNIPSTITNIGSRAFDTCISLTSVTIPSSVTSINDNAFEHCESLTTLTIPSSVTDIGAQAFYYCSGLTEIYVMSQKPPRLNGESVFDFTNNCPIYVPCVDAYRIANGWDEYAGRMVQMSGYDCQFAMQSHYNDNTNYSVFCFDTSGTLGTSQTRGHSTSYTAMTNVNIGSCINTIGSNAFEGCTLLTAATIPSSIYTIGDYAFRYDKGLTSITIPSSVTSINQYAFNRCSGATSITINGSPSIGQYAFEYCNKATSLNLGSTTSIANNAFYGCSGLTSLTIPSSVTSIGNNAFNYSSGLTAIYCSGETAPTIGNNVFDNTNNCPIYLPSCSSLTSYYDRFVSYRSRFVLPSDCPSGVALNLNNQWSGSTSYGNLSSAATEYFFYESYSNWHQDASTATTYLTLNNVASMWFYVRSYAEGSYDYVTVTLDGSQVYNGSGRQSSTTWNKVEINAGAGVHIVAVAYKKDGSVGSNDDRGYLAIPKLYICENTEEQWVNTGQYTCIGGYSYPIQKKQIRCVGDTAWMDTSERRTSDTSVGECTYTNLDYIVKDTSDATFTDLGLTLKDNTKFQIKVYPTANGGGMIIGELNAPSDNDDYRFFWFSNNIYYDYGSSRNSTSNSINSLKEYEIGNYYIKDMISGGYIMHYSTKSGTATSHTRNIGLFSGSDYCRLYYLKVYEGDTLVRNYIPVRDFNNVVTLYDTVNGNFLTPNGTFKGSDE